MIPPLTFGDPTPAQRATAIGDLARTVLVLAGAVVKLALASLWLFIVLWIVWAMVSAPRAHADVCDGPGLPPCAAPGTPEQQCAAIAWRTFTPCNWWGMRVPQGTPGSWG